MTDPYQVTWSPRDAAYVATSARFPSLSWLDPDPTAALDGIRNLVAEVLEDMATRPEG